MKLTKVEKNIATTIHDTLITQTTLHHFGIHTQQFCRVSTTSNSSTTDYRKSNTLHIVGQERDECCFYRQYAATDLIYPLWATLALI